MPGTNLGVSINILGSTLAAFGTHEQKLRHLPRLVPGYGSLLKLGNDLLAQRESELALRLAGSEGVTWRPDHPEEGEWSEQFLSLRRATIAGGTSEIQRNNVSERVLGLPRERASDRDVHFNEVAHN